MSDIIKTYTVSSEGLTVKVDVKKEDIVNAYNISIPQINTATLALLESIKEELIKETRIKTEEIFDPTSVKKIKTDFKTRTQKLLERRIPGISVEIKDMLIAFLLHETLGLGKLELLFADDYLEEIVINTSKEPIWVYHKEFGWLKTNVFIESEQEIQNYANIIGRRAGRQISVLNPLLDAHMITGDRANATLFPISTKGNTLTIRKFARRPWTITDFLENKTMTPDVAAMMWLVIQYELNMIIAGGTSSGKTSFLNTLLPFIQPNHRIISIEDTRELAFPDFLHWVPLTTREPNPEGKGEVSMLDLLINSLRMRPDRIIVGEIRRGEQPEVLFEAMHTGHSVYATLHADTVEQVIRRMTNPPINIPHVMMESLHCVAVVHRDRRKGIRRIYQLAELLPTGESLGNVSLDTNLLYRSKPSGEIVAHDESLRIFDMIAMHTGITRKEFNDDLKEKMVVLDWLVKNQVNSINEIGLVVAKYYREKEEVLKAIKQKESPKIILE